MLTLSLILAAAAPAAAPLPQSVRNDLQCMAIYAVAAGSADEAVKQVGGLGLIYYLGKVEVAAPQLDVAQALIAEITLMEDAATGKAAGERCGKDFEATGSRLIKLGGVMTAAGK